MVLLLLPLVVLCYALFLAFESGPHRSAEGRLQPPKTARLVAVAVNVIALGWYLYGSARLRPVVPADAPAGTAIYGGPGDGLFMLFMVVLPWLSMQVVNLPLSWASATSFRQFFGFWGLLVGCWLTAAYVGLRMMECPPGMLCAGG